MEKRMQIELRNAVDLKKKEGFDVKERSSGIIMSRGVVKIRVGFVGANVVVECGFTLMDFLNRY